MHLPFKQYYILLLLSLLVQGLAYTQDTLGHMDAAAPMTAYKDYDMFQKFCGYITGQSCSNYEVFAERYDISDSAEVIEIISHHTGNIKNIGRQVSFEIYTVGADKMPDQLLLSRSQSYRNLIVFGNPVSTPLYEPVKVGKSFFIALNFLDYAHYPLTDTIAILSSFDGSRPDSDLSNTGRNVLRIHHYNFVDLYAETGLKINLALFPVIRFPLISNTNDKSISNGNIKLYAPYPNPCINEVTVSYNLDRQSEISLSIINADGKQFSSKNLGSKSPGLHSEIVDVSNLPGGNYTLVVNSDGSLMGVKLIK